MASRLSGIRQLSEIDERVAKSPRQGEPKDQFLGRPRFVSGWRKRVKLPTTEVGPDRPCEEIDIWIAPAAPLLRSRSCLKLLGRDDWQTLGRLRDPMTLSCGVAARVLLRLALSHATAHEVEPSAWQFEPGASGKPIVAPGLPLVNFSVSHTRSLAVVVASRCFDVGIDVEATDQEADADVVNASLVPSEQRALAALSPTQRAREFFRFWTVKEAYTKMTTRGIDAPFSQIETSLDPPRLRADASAERMRGVHLETFYVSECHQLYHICLAIGFETEMHAQPEIHITSLADDGREAAATGPSLAWR
jgi:4'-phosphopantetheinyl transferase